jgi:hypothetical protein
MSAAGGWEIAGGGEVWERLPVATRIPNPKMVLATVTAKAVNQPAERFLQNNINVLLLIE